MLPSGALVIGLAAGIVCYWAATWLKHMIGYDDSLDVFGVHGVGGIVGAMLTGVFATSAVGGDAARGLLDGNPAQLWIQIKGMLWTIGWCGIATFVLLKLLDLVMGLRVDTRQRARGPGPGPARRKRRLTLPVYLSSLTTWRALPRARRFLAVRAAARAWPAADRRPGPSRAA